METALKILKRTREAHMSIMEGYKEKLAFAEFTKNESEIKTLSGLLQDFSSDLVELNTAIRELEELKTVAA